MSSRKQKRHSLPRTESSLNLYLSNKKLVELQEIDLSQLNKKEKLAVQRQIKYRTDEWYREHVREKSRKSKQRDEYKQSQKEYNRMYYQKMKEQLKERRESRKNGSFEESTTNTAPELMDSTSEEVSSYLVHEIDKVDEDEEEQGEEEHEHGEEEEEDQLKEEEQEEAAEVEEVHTGMVVNEGMVETEFLDQELMLEGNENPPQEVYLNLEVPNSATIEYQDHPTISLEPDGFRIVKRKKKRKGSSKGVQVDCSGPNRVQIGFRQPLDDGHVMVVDATTQVCDFDLDLVFGPSV